jgi:hypothetical protein
MAYPGGTRTLAERNSFDLELLESRTLDGNIQELIYRPPCMPE